MQLAKKTVITNSAKSALGVTSQDLEGVILELHKNDNDNFAIGDVKLSGRTISDANWKLCDGSFLHTSVPTDVRKNLMVNGSFNSSEVTGSDTNSRCFYADDNYLFVVSANNISSTTSGTRYVKLAVYTIGANGALSLNSTKTIASTTTTKRNYYVGNIIKCGNYYYLLYRFYNSNSETNTFYVSYATTPTGTWTNKTVMAEAGDSSTNCLGMYTNGTDVRVDVVNNFSGSNATVTTYTFTTTASSITTSTQSSAPAFSSNLLWNNGVEPYGIRAAGNGAYFRRGPSGYISYKSSFTANWQNLSKPSWSNDWVAYYYINSVHWGVFAANNSIVVAGANSLSDLRTLAQANLPYYYVIENSGGSTTGLYSPPNYSTNCIMGYCMDSSYNIYVYTVTTSGVTYKKVGQTNTSVSISNAILNDNTYAAGAFKVNLTDTTFYRVGLTLPNINNAGIRGYIKIANN